MRVNEQSKVNLNSKSNNLLNGEFKKMKINDRKQTIMIVDTNGYKFNVAQQQKDENKFYTKMQDYLFTIIQCKSCSTVISDYRSSKQYKIQVVDDRIVCQSIKNVNISANSLDLNQGFKQSQKVGLKEFMIYCNSCKNKIGIILNNRVELFMKSIIITPITYRKNKNHTTPKEAKQPRSSAISLQLKTLGLINMYCQPLQNDFKKIDRILNGYQSFQKYYKRKIMQNC